MLNSFLIRKHFADTTERKNGTEHITGTETAKQFFCIFPQAWSLANPRRLLIGVKHPFTRNRGWKKLFGSQIKTYDN